MSKKKKQQQDTDSSKPVGQRTKECGCVIYEMPDGNERRTPCIPCGMLEAGRMLSGAGQVLGAMAGKLKQEADQIKAQNAIQQAISQAGGK